MQRSRRRDPAPWTWEIPAAIVLAVVLALTLGAQLGRSVANLMSGAGWRWVPSAHLMTSVPGIVAGDAGSGLLPVHPVARAHLLWSCVSVVELVLCVGAYWGVKVGVDRWGPNRLRGMASQEEADKLLGRSRLRLVAPIIRPDLHGRQRR